MQSSHVIALFAQAPAYISGGSAHKVVIGKPLGYHPKEVDGSCERHKPGLKSAKKGLGSSCMHAILSHITVVATLSRIHTIPHMHVAYDYIDTRNAHRGDPQVS